MTTSSDNRAPAPVTKPGFYEVRTPDPERLVHYYQDALGLVVTERSGSTTYLTTGVDHHCVIVQPGGVYGPGDTSQVTAVPTIWHGR